MTFILGTASKVHTFDLSILDANKYSRGILLKTVEMYESAGKEVDLLLFECVKSTPGLLGHLAQSAKDSEFYLNLAHMSDHIVWLRRIVDENNIESNWKLILQYLFVLETDFATFQDESNSLKLIRKGIIQAEIGLGSSSRELSCHGSHMFYNDRY